MISLLCGIYKTKRDINNLRGHHPYGRKSSLLLQEELNSLLMKLKEESEKVGLKLSVQKTKFMVLGPITSCQLDGEMI